MTYLHGLSDFWVYLFDDASKVNALLEANALTASDIYNKFLQLTSVISLDGISTLTNSQLTLVLISDESNVGVENPTSGKVVGKVETYYLPTDVPLKEARYLANRAFLPTSLLEEGDFYIDQASGQISFARPIGDLGFPFRLLPSGAKQYALWAIDAKVDDQLLYNYYAKLIDINPTSSTDLFKNFVYGMYYLFVNGPNLETVKRGLNLVLGIPLARDVETVLEIKKYLNSDQWLVITDLNSYLVPYGLEPSVEVDDLLEVGQELASWIEVKDYRNDGDWWLNFMLPAHLMPHVPPSIPGGGGVSADPTPDRYMVAGSYADWLMRNYLKTHTFLVNVKTVGFKNIQSFEQLAKIIKEVKPAHTTPIYVWTVPIADEIIEIIDTLSYELTAHWCEPITDGISRFWRGSPQPMTRDICSPFIRMSAPASLDDQFGLSPETNGPTRVLNDGFCDGFISPARSFRALTDREAGWHTALRTRDQDQYMPTRSKLDFFRNMTETGAGKGIRPYADLYPGYRLVALYCTTLKDVKEKFAAASRTVPDGYIFDLMKPEFLTDLINEHAINDVIENSSYDFLLANFDYFFTKGTNGRYLGAGFPAASYVSYKPDPSALTTSDFLVFTRITPTVCAVYWATRNFSLETPPYIKHPEPDVLTMKVSGKITRGMAGFGAPYYLLRGADASISYNESNEIDAKPINENEDPSTTVTVTYSDEYNPPRIMDRSGVNQVVTRVWK